MTNLKGVLGVVQPQSKRISEPFHNSGENMYSPQHIGDQVAESFSGESTPKKTTMGLSSNEVMVFGDIRDIIHNDYS